MSSLSSRTTGELGTTETAAETLATSTAEVNYEVPAMQAIDDQTACAIAEAIEEENPGWIVVFGVYSRQFVCFPRFRVPRGTVLVARYPQDVRGRMREIERSLRIGDSRKDNRLWPRCRRSTLTASRRK